MKILLIATVVAIGILFIDAVNSHNRVVDACYRGYAIYLSNQDVQKNLYLLGKTEHGDDVGKINKSYLEDLSFYCEE